MGKQISLGLIKKAFFRFHLLDRSKDRRVLRERELNRFVQSQRVRKGGKRLFSRDRNTDHTSRR